MRSSLPPTDDLAGAWGSGLIALAAVVIVIAIALLSRFR